MFGMDDFSMRILKCFHLMEYDVKRVHCMEQTRQPKEISFSFGGQQTFQFLFLLFPQQIEYFYTTSILKWT